jgi:hypothetical protein
MPGMSFLREWLEFLFPLIIFVGLFLLRYISQFVKAKKLKEIAPYINGVAVVWPFSARGLALLCPSNTGDVYGYPVPDDLLTRGA